MRCCICVYSILISNAVCLNGSSMLVMVEQQYVIFSNSELIRERHFLYNYFFSIFPRKCVRVRYETLCVRDVWLWRNAWETHKNAWKMKGLYGMLTVGKTYISNNFWVKLFKTTPYIFRQKSKSLHLLEKRLFLWTGHGTQVDLTSL